MLITVYFDYCIIDLEKPYLLENHVICVEYTGDDKTRNEIIDMYTQLIQSFNNENYKDQQNGSTNGDEDNKPFPQ